MYAIRKVKMAVALVALAVAGLGALMVGLCLYVTVSWLAVFLVGSKQRWGDYTLSSR